MVTLTNSILQVTISNPDGIVTKIQYNGIENLLEEQNAVGNRGYWDLAWRDLGFTRTTGTYDRVKGTYFRIIVEKEEQVELSFIREWDPSLKGKLMPLNSDKRFIMLQGSSAFYSYAIYERLSRWPEFNLPGTRIASNFNQDWFCYMAVADTRQRKIPLPDDRLPERYEVLVYPEAVRLTNPIEEKFIGEVDDKSEYSWNKKDLKVRRWRCTNPSIAFLQLTPGNEFRFGGPVK
ncbi:hypothetical protein Nepgr_020660 [Nepenthes gracilis]|uniref:Uncharacterized protein n=1 Tax=Nepenthes gracilis TaxID=150966 RepID=A0AAD3SXD2_NEPGR|nr:hypothetical protein Nepgr_020660 [Nepenthes gracilis]